MQELTERVEKLEKEKFERTIDRVNALDREVIALFQTIEELKAKITALESEARSNKANNSFNTKDNVGDPNLEAELFSAVTGVPGEELEAYAERIFNTQREILLQEGREIPEADYPLESQFMETPENAHGQQFLIPGPGDTTIDVTGKSLDKTEYTNMLKEYYRLRKWDEETGLLSHK